MSDPKRWRDEADAPEGMRELLRHGNAVPPLPPDVRAAVRAALPEPPPTTGSSPSDKAIASTSHALGVSPWIGGGLAVIAMVLLVALRKPVEPVVAPGVAPPSSSVLLAPLATPSSKEAPPPEPEPPPPQQVAAPKGAPRARAPSGDILAEENMLIGRARSLLGGGNAEAAIVAMDEHARRFPRGELVPEREYLRISALRRLGRNAEARGRARTYVAAYPSSPHTPSVRTLLRELGDPP